jgi:hypothetical protein
VGFDERLNAKTQRKTGRRKKTGTIAGPGLFAGWLPG